MNTLTKTVFSLSFIFVCSLTNAQVGVGTDMPHSSSILDVSSPDKGVLIPRMSSATRSSISSPATGLLVFDTNTASFWFYDGNTWKDLSAGGGGGGSGSSPWNIQGTITPASGNNDDIYTMGSVAIGKSDVISGAGLDINGPIRGGGAADYATVGSNSIAFGNLNVASGENAIAFGSQTQSTGDYATTFGGATTASGLASVAFGIQTQAVGMGATAFGQATRAGSFLETVFGRNNIPTGGSTTNWVATDNLFVVGNGTGVFPSINSNALTIRKDGWMGVGAVSKHSTERLRVDGTIRTSSTTYPDYVFENYFNGVSTINPSYKLHSLDEIKAFISENHHLPGITSIKELERTETGSFDFNITELVIQQLEKIEELFLYTIEQDTKLKKYTSHIEDLEKRLDELNKKLESFSTEGTKK